MSEYWDVLNAPFEPSKVQTLKLPSLEFFVKYVDEHLKLVVVVAEHWQSFLKTLALADICADLV